MRFLLEQRFSAGLEAVEAAFVDPGLLAELAKLPELGRPEPVERVDDGHTVAQQVRYALVGDLSPAVTAVVDSARLTWVEHSELDRRTRRTVFVIRPDHYADRLACSGTVTLEGAGGGTVRVIEGDLRGRFPFLGAKVERAIASGLRTHAEAEARVVQAWLERGGPAGR